jgi:hypothetical protein
MLTGRCARGQMMKKSLTIAIALLIGFVAGIGAQGGSPGITMRGSVMDANTIAEDIQYWELRTPSGESVVITGHKNVPVIRWLREAKGRMIALSVESAR